MVKKIRCRKWNRRVSRVDVIDDGVRARARDRDTYHISHITFIGILNLEQFSVHPYAGYFRNLLVAVRILALISYFNLANLHDWRLDRMDR